MDISANAEVYCTDGHFGRLTLTIVDPIQEKVTHLVIREKNFPHAQFLVPVDHILNSDTKTTHLNCSCQEVRLMDPFSEDQYVVPDILRYGSDPFLFQPYIIPEKDFTETEDLGIPPGELAIRRGTRVKATDGPIGHVNELVIDPKTGHITHLVLREGHLWGQKVITIPVTQIDSIEGDTVFLKLDKQSVEALIITSLLR